MKKKIIFFSILGFFLTATIISLCCIFFIDKNKQPLEITCISSINLEPNETYSPIINCSDENASLSFSSSNTDVVEIVNNKFIGINEGFATIKVTASLKNMSVNKNISVIVKKTITNLNINLSDTTTLYLLDKQVNKANIDGYYGYTTYTSDYDIYHTQDNDNVNIKNGKITAIKEGETNITFTSVSQPNVSSTHKIIIKKFDPILSVSENKIAIKNNETKIINFTLIPSYYYGAGTITYKVNDTSIASIKNNFSTGLEIKGEKIGKTYIEFFLNDTLVKTIILEINTTGKINDKIYHYELIPENNTEISDNDIIVVGIDPTFSILILDENNNIGTDIGICNYDTMKITALLGGKYYINITANETLIIAYPDINLTINIQIKFT